MQCKVHDSVHGSEVNESTAMLCQLPALNLHDAHCVLHTRISDSRISGSESGIQSKFCSDLSFQQSEEQHL